MRSKSGNSHGGILGSMGQIGSSSKGSGRRYVLDQSHQPQPEFDQIVVANIAAGGVVERVPCKRVREAGPE